ncbi:L-xylulose reductase [Lamellibrachia satsuma]|nr:L-xylulose reductase [Lamellibrachia satsuma]
MVDRGKGGAIVNISSIASHMALSLYTSYCASKGALDQVTRVMALELGSHQIRTNSVNPTAVMTDMGRCAYSDPARRVATLARTPQGKFAEVTDVVHPVLYLLSDKADMINGVTFNVDGVDGSQWAIGRALVECLDVRHNDGRTQGDFSLEHGCIDDVRFIIWVDTTGHEQECVLASHLPDIDAD